MIEIDEDTKIAILKIIYDNGGHFDRGALIRATGMNGEELDNYIYKLESDGYAEFLIGSKTFKSHTDYGEWKHIRITEDGEKLLRKKGLITDS